VSICYLVCSPYAYIWTKQSQAANKNRGLYETMYLSSMVFLIIKINTLHYSFTFVYHKCNMVLSFFNKCLFLPLSTEFLDKVKNKQ
jgi:hypothetical protein